MTNQKNNIGELFHNGQQKHGLSKRQDYGNPRKETQDKYFTLGGGRSHRPRGC